MIELLAGMAGILAVLLVVAVVYAVTYRQERDEAFAHAFTLQATKDSLALSLQAAELKVKELERDNRRLAGENLELQREAGRYAAEIRQLKQEAAKRTQPRDPATGRMLPNPNAKRPRKSRAKAAPIACG